MPSTALIAGIPQSASRRAKRYRIDSPDFGTIPILISRQEKPEIESLWENIENYLNVPGTDLHVLAFHRSEDEYPALWARADYRFRIRWMDRTLLQLYGTMAFTAAINAELNEELSWSRLVMPKGHDDVLLLPYPFYGIGGDFATIWTRAQSGRAEEDFQTIFVMKEQMKDERHVLGTPAYRDDRKLEYKYSGQRHALPPSDRGVKFGYWFPDGFHYDVSHEHGSTFSYTGADRNAQRYHRYVNVDCFGYTRGGD